MSDSPWCKLSDEQKLGHSRKKEKRMRAIKDSLKMSGCCICGYNKVLSALEFHHVTDDKESEVNKLSSEKRIRIEAAKCIVVCANCHREIHAGLIEGLLKIKRASEAPVEHQQGELKLVFGAAS